MASDNPLSSLIPGAPNLSSPGQRDPDWRSAYAAVLAETETTKLFKLVEVAEAAVLTRRASLQAASDHQSERQAMEEALVTLRAVKRERLNFSQQSYPD